MRAFFLTLYCCFVAVSIAGSEPAPGIARHNVFLITIDTLRADHLHCYGYQKIQTPALDELASGGIRFAQAFTPSPITNTSHASILTGLLPSSHGVSDFGIALAGDHPTLAQTLEEKGPRMPPPRADPTREICRYRSLANLKSLCSFRNFTPNLLKRRSNKLQFLNLFSPTAHRVVNWFSLL